MISLCVFYNSLFYFIQRDEPNEFYGFLLNSE